MQPDKIVKISLAAISLMLTAVILLYFVTTTAEFGQQRASSLAELGGDFTLQSKQGLVSLSDFKGKAVVMYFGFLSCPEVCPNSMSVIAAALDKLPKPTLANTQVMLISIDPQRDTPEKLAAFTEYFHPKFIGLTGSQEEIETVTNLYGAYYNYTDIQSANSDYGVEHSSRYYVIDKSGKLVDAMRHSTTPNELAARLKTLI